MKSRPKRVWGSQPGKEAGGQSRQETSYLRKAQMAQASGHRAAQNPKASEAWCPAGMDEEERSYWLDAFRRERRRMAS